MRCNEDEKISRITGSCCAVNRVRGGEIHSCICKIFLHDSSLPTEWCYVFIANDVLCLSLFNIIQGRPAALSILNDDREGMAGVWDIFFQRT